MAEGTCSSAECDRSVLCRGLCSSCYRRMMNQRPAGRVCATTECSDGVWVRGLCRRCYKRAEYQRNRARYIANATNWNAEHVDRRREIARDHERRKRLAEPEAARARARQSMKRWRGRNPEQARAKNRADYAKHREKRVTRSVAWAKNNPERYRAIQRNREIRERDAPGVGVTHEQWQQILVTHGAECFYCGASAAALQLEHVVPLSRGGSHDPANVVPACSTCNQRKATRTAREFVLRLPQESQPSRGQSAG